MPQSRSQGRGRFVMGCCNGKNGLSMLVDRARGKKQGAGNRKKYLPQANLDASSSQMLRGLPEKRPEFKDEQKRIVLESWKIIQKDIARVGVVMFVGLFETHQDIQDLFPPFKGQNLDDLKHSALLKSHVMRVMGTVEKCLARIEEPDKLEVLLHELGARHLLYNARIEYIDLIGPQFICAVQPAMGDAWKPDIEAAWADLFRLISHIMKEAMTF